MSDHSPAINLLTLEIEALDEKITYLKLCLLTKAETRSIAHEGIRQHVHLRWQHTLSNLEARRTSITNSIKKLEGED